jgi:hypothetical protein
MPGGRNRSEQDLNTLELSPEQALIAAMLRTAVQDAKSTAKANLIDIQRREDAQKWLRDRGQVMWWIIQLGLPDGTYERLLREAGLDD